MNFNNSRFVDHKPMKFGTFVPYMYRFVIIVKYLTNFFKLEWNLGIKFTLRFFFLSVYENYILHAEYFRLVWMKYESYILHTSAVMYTFQTFNTAVNDKVWPDLDLGRSSNWGRGVYYWKVLP